MKKLLLLLLIPVIFLIPAKPTRSEDKHPKIFRAYCRYAPIKEWCGPIRTSSSKADKDMRDAVDNKNYSGCIVLEHPGDLNSYWEDCADKDKNK